jgi:hypothetical protein
MLQQAFSSRCTYNLHSYQTHLLHMGWYVLHTLITVSLLLQRA